MVIENFCVNTRDIFTEVRVEFIRGENIVAKVATKLVISDHTEL